MNYTLGDKIRILSLSEEQIQLLEEDIVKELDKNSVDIISKPYYFMLKVDDLVGTTRVIKSRTSWLEYLNDCHKGYIFYRYNEHIFDEVLVAETLDGFPVVYNLDGRYYIAGNGKHRLTIAKCLGNKIVKVIVYDCKIKE